MAEKEKKKEEKISVVAIHNRIALTGFSLHLFQIRLKSVADNLIISDQQHQ